MITVVEVGFVVLIDHGNPLITRAGESQGADEDVCRPQDQVQMQQDQ